MDIFNETKTYIVVAYDLEEKEVIYDSPLCPNYDYMFDSESIQVKEEYTNEYVEELHRLIMVMSGPHIIRSLS